MKKLYFLFALLFIFAVVNLNFAYAGPFGLEMGMKKSEIPGTLEQRKPDGNLYKVKDIKMPNMFEYLLLEISSEGGLYFIKAVSKDISTSTYGTRLKGDFESLEASIINKYGPTTKEYKFLRHGSIWDDPKDFMPALIKEERIHASKWEGGLPDDLDTIIIVAKGMSRSSGYLVLEYYFNNYDIEHEKTKKVDAEML